MVSTGFASAQEVGTVDPPLIVRGENYDLLLVTHRTLPTVSDDARMALLLGSCRRAVRISSADSALAVHTSVWDWRAESVTDSLAVTFVVLPSAPLSVSCTERELQDRIAATRGLRISYDALYSPLLDVKRVEFLRGSERIAPERSESALLATLTTRGMIFTGARVVRLTVPVDLLAPDASGERRDLALEIWNERDTIPTHFPIPWPVVAEAWQEIILWRVEDALASGSRRGAETFAPPLPSDGALRAARARYLEGDLAGASRLAVARMQPGLVSPSDYRNARVQLALTLVSAGDSSGARVMLGRVVADRPCFTLGATAPPDAARLMVGLRRAPARCTSNSPLHTMVRSALLPGFGRPAGLVRMTIGAAALGVIGSSITSGFSTARLARSTYDLYLAMDWNVHFNPADSARALYVKAEKERDLAKWRWQNGAVVWAATIVESLLFEAWHEHRLREVRSYGSDVQSAAPRSAALRPRATPGQVGFSITFF